MIKEGSKYKNTSAFKVSFDCADTNSKFYDNSKGEYDTSVTVIVVKEDGIWKVWGLLLKPAEMHFKFPISAIFNIETC